jgi:uncharacterized protein (TIGR02145 family)
MFPLITSDRGWQYSPTFNDYALNWPASPIRYNELFPALRLRAVLNMIEQRFGINFDGTTEEPSTFLSDARFTNAYLWLKNRDEFKTNLSSQIDFTTLGTITSALNVYVDLAENYFQKFGGGPTRITITPEAGYTTVPYTVKRYLNDQVWDIWNYTGTLITGVRTDADEKKHSFYIEASSEFKFVFKLEFYGLGSWKSATMDVQTLSSNISIRSYFPEIKIEDFFSGILKMFNLTCFSNDGINYTVETIDNYYEGGSDVDITKYVIQDKKTLNRVKTHKKINFDYEKSESFINVAFNSNAGIEYGSLHYSNTPPAEGEEYSIKLPFEDLNFSNLFGSFQVGYALKTDLQKYIPKPVILYDYNPSGTTNAGFTFYTSEALIGDGEARTLYKAFGQETLIGTETYGLNFNEQQSTLTNEIVQNGLYDQYYSAYFANIFNFKARLVKVSAILPTSILTTLKLNDRLIIRDTKYLINTFTTDLTSGVAQFELLTDQRVVEPAPEVLIGTQLWTNRNLDVETYRDGTVIPEVTDPTAWAGLTTGAWCYYANNTANGVIYGKLYNWYAVNDSRNLAPLGYHVPTDAEWTALTTYLGTNAGGKMKSTGTSLWTSPNNDATNESGFTGLPGGYRFTNGAFSNIGNYGFWWSSSEYGTMNAWTRYLYYATGDASKSNGNKTYGFSVRLIKD